MILGSVLIVRSSSRRLLAVALAPYSWVISAAEGSRSPQWTGAGPVEKLLASGDPCLFGFSLESKPGQLLDDLGRILLGKRLDLGGGLVGCARFTAASLYNSGFATSPCHFLQFPSLEKACPRDEFAPLRRILSDFLSAVTDVFGTALLRLSPRELDV